MAVTRRQLIGRAAAAVALGRAPQTKAQSVVPTKRPVAVSSANGVRAVELAVKQKPPGAGPPHPAIAGVNAGAAEPHATTAGDRRRPPREAAGPRGAAPST